MKITMLGEYAIRAMMHLAAHTDSEVINISAVSEKWDIPESILRKVIPQLRRGGFIQSTRGNSGGISLARDAHLITPLDIIECVEGEIVLNPCILDPKTCNRSEVCAMHAIWIQARDQLRQTLSSTSLSELVGKEIYRELRGISNL
jgi:Rrf2 family transcriptional regulator, iron-sulfur cluster assembly transcription factor